MLNKNTRKFVTFNYLPDLVNTRNCFARFKPLFFSRSSAHLFSSDKQHRRLGAHEEYRMPEQDPGHQTQEL